MPLFLLLPAFAVKIEFEFVDEIWLRLCLAVTTVASVRGHFLCLIPRKRITGEDARFTLRPPLSWHVDRFCGASADTDY